MTANQTEHIPKVSIGMPVFNGEKYIRYALDSLFAQTFIDFELVISDNGSTDATSEICKEYTEKDPRIRYVRQSENRGGHWNFNFVLQEAKGKYFTWLACDDVLESHFLEETVNFMTRNPKCVLVASDFEIIDKLGSRTKVEELDKIREAIKWETRCQEFFKYPISNVYFCIYGLMRTEPLRSALQFVSQPKIAAGSELPILARLAVAGEIASVPFVLRIYRRHPTSTYSVEVDAISKLPLLRRRSILIRNLYRLRFDQMKVLWSSSLSRGFKCVISIKVFLYYLRLIPSRAMKIPFKVFRVLKIRTCCKKFLS